MKIRLTLLLICVSICTNLSSQSVSFPISYDLTLNIIKDKNDHRNNPAETLYEEVYLSEGKRKSFTLTYTKFYPDMMDKLVENFVKHIEFNQSVKNYFSNTYYSGIPQMNRNSIKKMSDPALYEKWGGYYLDLESAPIVWNEDRFGIGKSWLSDILIGYDGFYKCEMMQLTHEWPPYDVYDTLMCFTDGTEFIEGMGFCELWSFDEKNGKFNKDVKMLSLRQFLMDPNTNELRGITAPINFKSTSKLDTSGSFKKNMRYDVLFDHWNEADNENPEGYTGLRSELSNSSSTKNRIETNLRSDLFASIMNAIKSGTLIALDANAYSNKKEVPISYSEACEALVNTETIEIQDPFPPYDFRDTSFYVYKDLSAWVGIRFVEDWSFEPITFNFYKNIKAFALLISGGSDYSSTYGPYKIPFYLKPNNK